MVGKIKNISKERYAESGEDYLKVSLEIFDGKKFVTIRHLGFPIDTTKKTVQNECKKYVATFENDLELGRKSLVTEKINKKADKIIKDLTGSTI